MDSIAIGAGILGTGGGGNPYIGQLRARQAIRQWGPVTVLAPEELPDDARVVCVGGIGAPTVGIEKVRDLQSYHALRAIEDFTGEKATALISNEIGGSNSVEPLIPAAMAGLPVVDADGMGRAFPEFQMKTFFVYGVPCCPMAIADEKGNSVVIRETISPVWAERLARSLTVQMGCVACYAVAPMTAEQVRRTAVPNTLSLARRLGDAVKEARAIGHDPLDAILDTCPGPDSLQRQGDRPPTAHHRRVRPGDTHYRRSGRLFRRADVHRVPEREPHRQAQRRNGLHCAGPDLRRSHRRRRTCYHRADALWAAGDHLRLPGPGAVGHPRGPRRRRAQGLWL